MKGLMKMLDKSKRGKAGFTLVELMIVIIIVGILAAVAVPLYRGYTRKAMSSEAIAALGTVRTAMRVMHAETQDYTDNGSGTAIAAPSDVPGVIPGIDALDLNGRYFSDADYQITAIAANTFTITATGSAIGGSGDGFGDAEGITVTMDEDGESTYDYTAPPPLP